MSTTVYILFALEIYVNFWLRKLIVYKPATKTTVRYILGSIFKFQDIRSFQKIREIKQYREVLWLIQKTLATVVYQRVWMAIRRGHVVHSVKQTIIISSFLNIREIRIGEVARYHHNITNICYFTAGMYVCACLKGCICVCMWEGM